MRAFRRITLALWAMLLVFVLGLELVAGQKAHALGHGEPAHAESCLLCVLAAAESEGGSTPSGVPAFVPTCWLVSSAASDPLLSAIPRSSLARAPPVRFV